MKESYTLDDIIEILAELQELGVDIDALPNEMTIHEVHKLLDSMI